MKKLFLLFALSFALFSCKKEDSKSCYEFTTKIVTTVSPNIAGYPQTTTSVTEQCGLTPVDAQAVAENLTSTSTSTQSNYTITVRQTCTYKLK
jgi:hypothetical protein